MKKIIKYFFVILFILLIIFIFAFKDIVTKNIYPIKYYDIVKKYSEEYNVDKYLVFAIIKAESNFNENAASKKGAKGLMQLIDSTAKEVAESINVDFNEEDILKPEINIRLGTKYISSLLKQYGNISIALAAYNAGSGNVDGWIKNNTIKKDGTDLENIPYKETKNYVRKILKDYEIYKNIYQEEG